jgi:phosphotransferase system  glucose/maltose/N-acetylglucosamine-specific IIC component
MMGLQMLSKMAVNTHGKTKKVCVLLFSHLQNALAIFGLHCSFCQPDGCGYLVKVS